MPIIVGTVCDFGGNAGSFAFVGGAVMSFRSSLVGAMVCVDIMTVLSKVIVAMFSRAD